MGELLRLSGEPEGNTSSTGIPIMVDPTVVDNDLSSNIRQKKRPKLSNECSSLTFQEQVEQNRISEKI